MDEYLSAIKYLESFVNYEQIRRYSYKKSFGLKRIKNFLRFIGNPEQKLKIIHIAGSKGKGSTCAFTAYILRAAGFSVGLYTSPHLSDFRERIRILKAGSSKRNLIFEGMISRRKLASLANGLKPAINKYNRISKYGKLSFFEVYTALAFLYFKQKKVDFVVLETGLGGALDATNAAPSLVCAITPISYEHTQYLGSRISEIAGEKAAIIKQNNTLVLSASQRKEAQAVIRDRCANFNARLYEVGRDIKYFAQARSGCFSVKGINRKYGGLRLRLLGAHQLSNAALAIGIVEALSSSGVKISVAQIRRGLYNTLWPGRCEVLSCAPLIVVDGAQNVASAEVLKTAIKENFGSAKGCAKGAKYNKLILVFGACLDKDIKGMLKQLSVLAEKIIFTSAQNARSAPPASLPKYLRQRKKDIYITNNVEEAKRLAMRLAEKDDLILVTGSLFIVGAFRNA